MTDDVHFSGEGSLEVEENQAKMQNGNTVNFQLATQSESSISMSTTQDAEEAHSMTVTLNPKNPEESLEGSVESYKNPTEPVAPNNWDAMKQ